MLSKERVVEELARLRLHGIVVALPAELRGIAWHIHDEPVLETAIVGEADCLVAGDRQLLGLGEIHGIPILSPQAFLAFLRGD
jgi:predicted nucleic acid-binding protein